MYVKAIDFRAFKMASRYLAVLGAGGALTFGFHMLMKSISPSKEEMMQVNLFYIFLCRRTLVSFIHRNIDADT